MDNRILWDIIDGLRDEVNVAQDGITDLNDEVKRLKEEHDYNEGIAWGNGKAVVIREYKAEVEELKAEIKSLKADAKHDADVCYDLDDKHIKIIEELKAELDKAENFRQCMYNDMDAEVRELKAENKRLYQEHKQCREDAVSHYPKEYKAEAGEYFSHNPHDEKLFFFMVGGCDVDEDGDVKNTLNVGVDCIAECDNNDGDVSVRKYR